MCGNVQFMVVSNFWYSSQIEQSVVLSTELVYNRPFTAKPSPDLLDIKITVTRNEKKHVEDIKMAKLETPAIEE